MNGMNAISVETVVGLLSEYCEHDGDILPDTELLESGMLDSLAFIELLNALEDMGCTVQPTRYPRSAFSTPRSIADICARAGISENDPA